MVGIHIHPDLEERMAELVDTAIVSLDGYIEDETGSFDWAMRDPEAHLRQPPRRGCPHPSLRPSHVRDLGCHLGFVSTCAWSTSPLSGTAWFSSAMSFDRERTGRLKGRK